MIGGPGRPSARAAPSPGRRSAGSPSGHFSTEGGLALAAALAEGACPGLALLDLTNSLVGEAAGAALAGGGVYGASVSEAEPAPPPLPVLPVPDETDRWSDVASSDEEGDVDSVHKSMLRC